MASNESSAAPCQECGGVLFHKDGCSGADENQALSAVTVKRTPAMVMRGTSADAPKVRRLLDEAAARLPNDDLGHALYAWAEEVTRLVEGRD